MFGQNEIVGKAYFKDEPEGTLIVTSVFYTLQGEGPYSGQPCVFIRLSKCNLACSFCDTLFDQGQRMTFSNIMQKVYHAVTSFWKDQGKEMPEGMFKGSEDDGPIGVYNMGLVITGGEPTLQKNLESFLRAAQNCFRWTQIETNGIITLDLPKHTTIVVSPKCAEKEGRPTQYLKPSPAMLEKASCLKFVMCAPNEANENGIVNSSPYSEVPQWAHEWNESTGKPIYLSPMNVYKSVPQKMRMMLGKEDKTIEERSTIDEVVSFWEPGVLDMGANRRNHEYAARYALLNGFRFQLQAHLYAGLA